MKVDIILDNMIRIDKRQIARIDRVLKPFARPNPVYFRTQNMGFSTAGIEKIIRSYTINGNYVCFYRGCWRRLVKLLRFCGYDEFNIDDRRIKHKNGKIDNSIKLRDYQVDLYRNMRVVPQGVLNAVCGSGKTIMALKCIFEDGYNTLVVVHTKDLMDQWIDNIRQFSDFCDIGVIGSGKKKIGRITVGLQQSLVKVDQSIIDEFSAVYFDECHHVPARTFTVTANRCKGVVRRGLTANDSRSDGLYFLVNDCIGDIVAKIDDKGLGNYVHDVTVRVVKIDCGIRNVYTSGGYPKLINRIVSDNHRNRIIKSFITHELDDGRQCIVMSGRRSHVIDLYTCYKNSGYEVGIVLGGLRKENYDTIEMLRCKKIQAIFATTNLFNEGLDVPNVERGFILVPTAGNQQVFRQQVGRVKRVAKGKTDAIVYYFWDYLLFRSHLRKIKNNYMVEVIDGCDAVN